MPLLCQKEVHKRNLFQRQYFPTVSKSTSNAALWWMVNKSRGLGIGCHLLPRSWLKPILVLFCGQLASLMWDHHQLGQTINHTLRLLLMISLTQNVSEIKLKTMALKFRDKKNDKSEYFIMTGVLLYLLFLWHVVKGLVIIGQEMIIINKTTPWNSIF